MRARIRLRSALVCLQLCVAPQLQAADTLLEAETSLHGQRTRPDAAQFERAKAIVAEQLQRKPSEARAWTLQAWASMLEHRFEAALAAAENADRLAPDDPRTLALMSDALVELGRYDAAACVTQRLADLTPGIPAWTRAAHLRFLFNDLAGAIQIMAMAARAGEPRGEASAWTWLDLARLYLHAGNPAAAEAAIARAERAYPGLPATLTTQAQVKLTQGDAGAALDLYRRALHVQVTAEAALAAWQLARQLGQHGAEKHHAALLDGLARLDGTGASRRALAEYFTASGQSKRAVELARQELASRPDIYSHATLARALQRAGNTPEAQEQAHAALALHTPDAQLQADMAAVLAVAPGAQARR